MRIFYYKNAHLSRAFRIFIHIFIKNSISEKLLKILKKLFSKSFLSGARTLACGKLQLCLVGLRLHFPSENRQSCTASRFNAKAIAFASMLQKDEALLRLFGRSQYFRKGESVALRPPAPEGRSSLRSQRNISPLILPGRETLRGGADCPPQPLPQAGGAVRECRYFR